MKCLLLVLVILAGLAQTGNAQDHALFSDWERTSPSGALTRTAIRSRLISYGAYGSEDGPTALLRASAFSDSPGIQDLSLVEIPATTSARSPFAVLLSGDGGWASIDKSIGKVLANHGIPVVGWSTLTYFWTARTPEAASHDLERILEHYSKKWNKQKVILAGYSFGADVLPFLITRLPKDLTSRVTLVALLGLGKKAEFEFHLTNWIGWVSDDALPVLPEVDKLKGMSILCFAGDEENDSLCPDLGPSLAKTIILPGGHHFGGHYDTIANDILVHAEKNTQ